MKIKLGGISTQEIQHGKHREMKYLTESPHTWGVILAAAHFTHGIIFLDTVVGEYEKDYRRVDCSGCVAQESCLGK